MIQRRRDLLIAEGKFACLTKYTKHTHYFGTKAIHFSTLSFLFLLSRMKLHAFREGLLNLGLSRYTTPRDPSPVTISPQPPRYIFSLTVLSNDVLCPTWAHGVGQHESLLKNKNKENSQVMQWHLS